MKRSYHRAVHSRERQIVHAIARIAVAGVFLWHGLVPKLIFRHPDEAVMLTDAGVSAATATLGVIAAGIGEVALGIGLIIFWRARAPLVVIIGLMAIAIVLVGWHSPRFLVSAFNPITLNSCVIALATIALLTSRHHPAA